jgi:hypothetical protein
MVHLDGVKRAVLGAVTTVHADIDIDIKFGRVRDRTTCIGITRTHDPDALRWTYLSADTTRGTTILLNAVIFDVNQEGNVPELFRNWQFLFRVLDCEDPTHLLAAAIGDTFG